MHCKKLGSGNSFGTSAKRCELSWTGPIERNGLLECRAAMGPTSVPSTPISWLAVFTVADPRILSEPFME